jgi:hypothetical protein
VAVWDASTGTVGSILGPAPAVGVASDGRRLAWYEATCGVTHIATLDRTGPPTAPHVSPGNQQLALSPDGEHLAVLRPTDGAVSLVLVDLSTGEESVEATMLGEYGELQWSRDSQQLFYTENSYLEPSTRIGRYAVANDKWEAETIPVGDGLAAIAIDPKQARTFLNDDYVDPAQCLGEGGTYPSGRDGVCTFRF